MGRALTVTSTLLLLVTCCVWYTSQDRLYAVRYRFRVDRETFISSFDGALRVGVSNPPEPAPPAKVRFVSQSRLDVLLYSYDMEFKAAGTMFTRDFLVFQRLVNPALSYEHYSLPLWLLAVVFAVLPSLAGIKLTRRLMRQAHGKCAQCGYDLRASAQRCPECGSLIPDESS
jgi:hypothetical protein